MLFNKPTKPLSRKVERVFAAYSFDEDMKSVFKSLREKFDKKLVSDELLGILICRKRSFEKCIAFKTGLEGVCKKYNFGKIDLSKNLMRSLTTGFFILLPKTHRTKTNLRIVVIRVKYFLEYEGDIEYKAKVFCLIMQNVYSNNPDITVNGFHGIVDLKGVKLKTSYYPYITKIQSILKCLPFRPQNISVINAPWFFGIAFKIVKPFMAKKIIEKIELTKKEKLLEYMDKRVIPTEYDGEYFLDLEEHVLENICFGSKKLMDEYYPTCLEDDEINRNMRGSNGTYV